MWRLPPLASRVAEIARPVTTSPSIVRGKRQRNGISNGASGTHIAIPVPPGSCRSTGPAPSAIASEADVVENVLLRECVLAMDAAGFPHAYPLGDSGKH